VAYSCSCVVYAVHVVGGWPGRLSVCQVVLDSGAACSFGWTDLQERPGCRISMSCSACAMQSLPWRRMMTRDVWRRALVVLCMVFMYCGFVRVDAHVVVLGLGVVVCSMGFRASWSRVCVVGVLCCVVVCMIVRVFCRALVVRVGL